MKKEKVLEELYGIAKTSYMEQISAMTSEDEVKSFILKQIKSSPHFVSQLREAIELVTKFTHLAKLINLQ